jgi:opacity protein-like surface antigen
VGAFAVALFAMAQPANAAEAEPPSAPGSATGSAPARPAKTGFQAHFRTGVSAPMGNASGDSGDKLARRYAWQIPFAVDLGAKVTRFVFVGGYLHLGVGAEGSDARVEDLCDDDDEDWENDVSCSAVNVRLGIEAEYGFDPGGHVSPWLGYGFGMEAGVQSIRDSTGYRENNTATGITWAQLSGGLDVRNAVGWGPFAELSLGRYMTTRTEVGGQHSTTDIDDRAFHVWATLGMRLVVRP